jgi:hypothetical protein
MQTAHGNLHLEIQTSRKSPVGILRTSFRKNGKMKHTQHGRITGCSLEQLKILQLAFRERVVPVDDPQAFQILSSREYGASYSILTIAKQLGLHQVLYSRPEPWVSGALAMIIGRLLYAGSKLSLCNHHPNTCLWELCGIEDPPDVDAQCYEPMDRLLQRQGAIQRNLARRHLGGGHLVLYDITSVYFEGEYKTCSMSAASMRSPTRQTLHAAIACAATRRQPSARARRGNGFWISPQPPWPESRHTNAQRP